MSRSLQRIAFYPICGEDRPVGEWDQAQALAGCGIKCRWTEPQKLRNGYGLWKGRFPIIEGNGEDAVCAGFMVAGKDKDIGPVDSGVGMGLVSG